MSPQADLVIRRELARCDAEQRAAEAQAPNLGAKLGWMDWDLERAAILREADPARWPYRWNWNRYLARYHGWPCRVSGWISSGRGSLNSALVVFPDGYQVVTSRNGLRKRHTQTAKRGESFGAGGCASPGSYGETGPCTCHGGAGEAWRRTGPSVEPPSSVRAEEFACKWQPGRGLGCHA